VLEDCRGLRGMRGSLALNRKNYEKKDRKLMFQGQEKPGTSIVLQGKKEKKLGEKRGRHCPTGLRLKKELRGKTALLWETG